MIKISPKLILFLLTLTIIFCTPSPKSSDAALDNKEVLPQYKEEVSALYQECLNQKHGAMIECIKQKVQDFNQDTNILVDIQTDHSNEVTAPAEFIQQENKIPKDNADLNRGKEVFQYYCAGCHGLDAHGTAQGSSFRAVNLTSARVQQKSDGEIFWRITEGKWPMPSFWEDDLMTENDLWNVIHYLRSLAATENSAVENNDQKE